MVDQQWDFGSIVSLKPIQFSFSVNLSWYFFYFFFVCFFFEILLFSTLIRFSLHMLLLLLLPVFFAVEFGHEAQKKKEKLEKKQKKAKKSSSSHLLQRLSRILVSGCFRCHLSFLFGRLTNLMIPSSRFRLFQWLIVQRIFRCDGAANLWAMRLFSLQQSLFCVSLWGKKKKKKAKKVKKKGKTKKSKKASWLAIESSTSSPPVEKWIFTAVAFAENGTWEILKKVLGPCKSHHFDYGGM